MFKKMLQLDEILTTTKRGVEIIKSKDRFTKI